MKKNSSKIVLTGKGACTEHLKVRSVENPYNGGIVPVEVIENRIFIIRGQRVMIDRDLAQLYEVETKYLNRQVRKNIRRFPIQFAFKITEPEKNELVHFCHRFKTMKHSTSTPYAFTEHGVAMLASVLNSERAITLSVLIIEVFIRLRHFIFSNKELAAKIAELEHRIGHHDQDIISLFSAINKIIRYEGKPKERIGFIK